MGVAGIFAPRCTHKRHFILGFGVLKGLGSEVGVKSFPRKLLSFCGLEMAYLSAYLVQCTRNSVI